MPQTTAGTVLAVSLVAPATDDLAGWEALYPTMNNVGEITDMGEYDRVYQLVTTVPLANRRTQKYKGSYDEGSMALTFNIETGDVGQDDLRTQSKLDSNAYIAITHQDGTRDFFEAIVMSASKVVGSSDQMYTSNCTLEINSNILEAAAL